MISLISCKILSATTPGSEISFPIINEIMYDPITGYAEWLEIYNPSGDLLTLEGWSVTDLSGASINFPESLTIDGCDYLIIASARETGFLIDSSALYCDHNLPSLNNSGDHLVLRDTSGVARDSVRYQSSWGGGDGRSLERKNPWLSGYSQSNWTSSLAWEGATPGIVNSVLPDSNHIEISAVDLPGKIGVVPDTLRVRCNIVNAGLHSLTISHLRMYDDKDYDGIPEDGETIALLSPGAQLGIGDTTTIDIQGVIENPGLRLVTLTATAGGEILTLIQTTVAAVYEDPVFRINEIMYRPNRGPEWIELLNISKHNVPLFGWTLRDGSSVTAEYPEAKLLIPPDSFAVLSGDSSLLDYYPLPCSVLVTSREFPTLNNGNDVLIIRSPAGIAHDSVAYFSAWGGKSGVSLERRSRLGNSNDPENWGSSVDLSGATPGRSNSLAIPQIDGGLLLSAQEYYPGENSVFQITVSVVNSGLDTLEFFTNSLYHDLNENRAPDADELLLRLSSGRHPPGDTAVALEHLPLSVQGYQRVIGVTEIAGDQNTGNDTSTVEFFIGYTAGDLEINEIMYRPEYGEPEWFEMIVIPETIDMRGFSIRDRGHEAVIDLNKRNTFRQGEHIVISNDSSLLQSFPGAAPLLEISDLPALNNGVDSVILLDPGGVIIAAMEYQSGWGGGSGISLERRDLSGPVYSPENWGNCLNKSGATPGHPNSIALQEYHVHIDDTTVKTIPAHPHPLQPWSLISTVHNSGKLPVDHLIYRITGLDGHLFSMDSTTLNPPLYPNTKRELEIQLPGLESGYYRFRYALGVAGKSLFPDDTTRFALSVPFEKDIIRITEFAPDPGEDWDEFVEIYNASSSPVNLAHWKIGDATGSVDITSDDVIVQSGSYAVITASNDISTSFIIPAHTPICIPDSWRSLNNSGDQIRILDPSSLTIDSLRYTAEWGMLPEKSMERLRYLGSKPALPSDNPQNWKASLHPDGATPGRMNSVAVTEQYLMDITRTDRNHSGYPSTLTECMFTCINTGLDAATGIRFILGFDMDNSGALVDDEVLFRKDMAALCPLDSAVIACSVQLPESAGSLPLIARVESDEYLLAQHISSIWIPYSFQTLLFTEVFPDPSGFYPGEFLEIYNRGAEPIFLNSWSIQINDRLSLLDSVPIPPGEFLVVEEDSLPLSLDYRLQAPVWTGLPNSGARIALCDPFGYPMDTLLYSDHWGMEQGRSLERLHREPAANTSLIWKTSFDRTGATPGRINSFMTVFDSLETLWSLTPNPFSPDGDGFDDQLRIVYNGVRALEYVTLLIFDAAGRPVRTVCRNQSAPCRSVWHWDGRTDGDKQAAIGIYIIHMRYRDISGRERTGIETVVLARRL